MRVIYFRRHAWTILLAVCIFIGGNIVLFYKFMVRKELEHKRAQKIAKQYFENLNAKPSSRLANLANYINKKNLNKPFGPKTNQVLSENDVRDVSTSKVAIQTRPEVKVVSNVGTQDDLGIKSQRSDAVQQGKQISQQVTQKEEPGGDELIRPAQNYKFGILVIACNRPTVKRSLDLLIKYRPTPEKFPIVVSQDCGDSQTAAAIKTYGDQVTHIQQPDLGDVKGIPGNMFHFMGYYKISRHYKWALTQMFDVMKYETVIIVEDDLDIGKIQL